MQFAAWIEGLHDVHHVESEIGEEILIRSSPKGWGCWRGWCGGPQPHKHGPYKFLELYHICRNASYGLQAFEFRVLLMLTISIIRGDNLRNHSSPF